MQMKFALLLNVANNGFGIYIYRFQNFCSCKFACQLTPWSHLGRHTIHLQEIWTCAADDIDRACFNF